LEEELSAKFGISVTGELQLLPTPIENLATARFMFNETNLKEEQVHDRANGLALIDWAINLNGKHS
jgi:hypothetical protein